MKAQQQAAEGEPEGGKAPEFWEGVITRLKADKSAAEVELDELDAACRPLALPATTGDRGAMERVAEFNARRMETRRRTDLLTVAVGDAEERLAATLAERARAEAEVKKGEGQALALALLGQSKRADAALREAAAALSARAALARQLNAHGGNYAALTSKGRLAAAAGHAGLTDQLEMRRSPRGMHAPLPAIDAVLLRGLLPPGTAEAEEHGPVVQVGPLPPPRPVPPAPPHDPSVRW